MKRFILLTIAGMLVYFFFSPGMLTKEYFWVPQWKAMPGTESDSTKVRSYVAGNRLGFFSVSGKHLYQEGLQYSSVHERTVFSNVSFDHQYITWKDYSGESLLTMETDKFPFLQAGRFFLMDYDRGGFNEIDSQGISVYSRRVGSLITVFTACKDYCAAGTVDGRILISAGMKTRTEYTLQSTGGKSSCVYSLAVNEDGSRLAAISGLNPQILTIYKKTPEGFLAEKKSYEMKDNRMAVESRFLADSLFYVLYSDELVLLNFKDGSRKSYGAGSSVKGFFNDKSREILIYCLQGPDSAELVCERTDGKVLFRQRFDARDAVLIAEDDSVYLGNGTGIYSYRQEHL